MAVRSRSHARIAPTRLPRLLGRAALILGAATLTGACASAGGFPTIAADAEPIPGGCPPSICPRHTPTQPPPPDEPSPEPTTTASKKPNPQPSRTTGGGAAPPAPGDTTPTPSTPGQPAPSVAPSKVRFAAFPFPEVPFDQAFPAEPPPPPAPLPVPPPTALVALAAVLAAGVAAASSMTARRRTWPARPLAPGGGPA
jgi:hypothetical protein